MKYAAMSFFSRFVVAQRFQWLQAHFSHSQTGFASRERCGELGTCDVGPGYVGLIARELWLKSLQGLGFKV